jgi:hypothetical protein
MKVVHVGVGPEVGEDVDYPLVSHLGYSRAEVNERLRLMPVFTVPE